MLELADRKFKAAIVNTSKDLKEKIRKHEQIENATREMENAIKNHWKSLNCKVQYMKWTRPWMGFNSKLEMAEDRVNELADRAIKII